MPSTLDIIFYRLKEYSAGDTPFTDMTDGNSRWDKTEDLKSLIGTIENFRTERAKSDNEMYTKIQKAFETYVEKQSDKTIHFADITIDIVVRPYKCENSKYVVFNNNEVSDLDSFYRPILFLVMLLYMKHKGIPEDKFFSKSTGILKKISVSLYNHLLKKRGEQEGACKDLFQKLIDVYEFVYPGKSNLAIRMPQEGARRTRYRKRKGKAKARKTRRY
jgi:hypothetical protein